MRAILFDVDQKHGNGRRTQRNHIRAPLFLEFAVRHDATYSATSRWLFYTQQGVLSEFVGGLKLDVQSAGGYIVCNAVQRAGRDDPRIPGRRPKRNSNARRVSPC